MAEPAPSWLNLDEVCPAHLRQQAATITARVLELVAEARVQTADAVAVLGDIDQRRPTPACGVTSMYEVVAPYTGEADLRRAFAELGDLVEAVTG